MPNYYLDTSVLVKRYVAEVGSQWVRSNLDPAVGHRFFTSTLARVELVAALMRRARASGPVMLDVRSELEVFRGHWQFQYRRLGVSRSVLDVAVEVAERHTLRGYDAVHLATAPVVAETGSARGRLSLIFASADDEQLAAAAAEGLITLNPATMPSATGDHSRR